MFVIFVVSVVVSQSPPPLVQSEPWAAPPLVEAPPSSPPLKAAPAPAPVETTPAPADDAPFFGLRALATSTVGLPFSLAGAEVLLGGRVELDLWRLQAQLTWDRAATTPFTLSTTDQLTGSLGFSVLSKKWVQVRLQAGAAAQSTAEGPVQVGPLVGASLRVGWSALAVEAATTLSPFGLPTFDARAALVLRTGPLELQAGWRAHFVDAAGSLGTLFETRPVSGPSLALGLSL